MIYRYTYTPAWEIYTFVMPDSFLLSSVAECECIRMSVRKPPVHLKSIRSCILLPLWKRLVCTPQLVLLWFKHVLFKENILMDSYGAYSMSQCQTKTKVINSFRTGTGFISVPPSVTTRPIPEFYTVRLIQSKSPLQSWRLAWFQSNTVFGTICNSLLYSLHTHTQNWKRSVEKYKNYGILSKTTHFLSVFYGADTVQRCTESQRVVVRDGLIAPNRQGKQQQRPESPTVTLRGMRVSTGYINSTKGIFLKLHP